MTLSDKIKQQVSFEMLLAKMNLHTDNSGFMQSFYVSEMQRTGSLKVNFRENYYKCFATNEGGSVIDFYKDYYGIDVATAIKELAGLFGIEGEKEHSGREVKRSIQIKSFDEWINKNILEAMSEDERYIYEERLSITGFDTSKQRELTNNVLSRYNEIYDICVAPVKKYRQRLIYKVLTEFYKYCLSRPNRKAVDYLTIERGFSDKALQYFKIFTINNYNEVSNHLKKVFSLQDLIKTGLYNEKGNLIFYNHRIIIPYLRQGYIIYCRARYFAEAGNWKSDGCKYLGLKNDALNLNSPKRFYNFDALEKMHPMESLYFTEGELDVVAMYELNKWTLGIPGASNLPDSGIEEIVKFRNLIYAGESDKAGMGLYEALKEKITKAGKQLDRVIFPQHIKDANELLCQN